jgi:outer membrane protein assembly factor BamB
MNIFGLSLVSKTGIAVLSVWAGAMLCDTAVAAPAMSVSPPAGPPTTSVTVSGTGFSASALVDIYFDTTDLCLTIAGGTGNIRCVIQIPKDAQPQTHWISAVQRSTSIGAQKSITVRTDWAQFHGRDAKHTGFNPFENTLNTSNVANLDTLWRAPISPAGGYGTYSTPVVANGKVYIGAVDGKLYAFLAKTGTPVPGFPKTLGAQVIHSSPAVGFGNVYVATAGSDHKLYAFNATTGAAVAGFPVTLGDVVYSSPTLFGGNVYLGCGDGKVYGFNATTGAAVPGFPVVVAGSGNVYATVSAAHDRIFVGAFDGGSFYAFDSATGAAIAGYPKPTGRILSTAAIVSGQVFFASADDHYLYGVRAGDGQDLSGFPFTAGSVHAGSPAVGDGQVIVGSTDNSLYSYSTVTGAARWSVPLDDFGDGSPILANGVVYMATRRSLYALSASTGTLLWRAAIPTYQFNSPTVADGIVFIGSSDGHLYAFSLNGMAPSSRLPGGELGIKPALSSLKPNLSLKAPRN